MNSLGREKPWSQNGFSEEAAGKVHPTVRTRPCFLLSPPKTFLGKCVYHLRHGPANLTPKRNHNLIYFALTVLDNHEDYHAIPCRLGHWHGHWNVTQLSRFQISPFLPLSLNIGYCCHCYSLPWLDTRARASRVRFTLPLEFFQKRAYEPKTGIKPEASHFEVGIPWSETLAVTACYYAFTSQTS